MQAPQNSSKQIESRVTMDSLRERLAQTWHAMASRSTSNSNQAQAAVESSGEPSIDDLEVSTMSIRQNVNAAKSEADPHQPGFVPLRGGCVAATQQFSDASKHEHCITTGTASKTHAGCWWLIYFPPLYLRPQNRKAFNEAE